MVTANHGDDSEILRSHCRETRFAGVDCVRAGLEIQCFCFVVLALLLKDDCLNVDRVANGAGILRELRDRERHLETVQRGIDVCVELIRSRYPTQERRCHLSVGSAFERVQRPLVERARIIPPTFTFGELRLPDQFIDRGLHRLSDACCK